MAKKIKVKTKKSAAKRFSVTKNGKVKYAKQGRRHLLSDKSSKRKRILRVGGILKPCEQKRVKSLLPYA
jgi:large subunit ribosomal protein L35